MAKYPEGYVAHWRKRGMVPGLCLRRAQVRALSEADEQDLREEFDADDGVIARLRELAAAPGQENIHINFETMTVSLVNDRWVPIGDPEGTRKGEE